MKHGLRTLRLLLAALTTAGALAGSAQAYVYWTNAGPGNNSDGTTIGRANLDGGGIAHSFITGQSTPAPITVDSGHIYWGNIATNSIGRANLDGTGANPNFIPNAAFGGNLSGLATDGTYIYWTAGGRYVGRATLAGSSVAPKFIDTGSGNSMFGIVVSAGTLYLGGFDAIYTHSPAPGGSTPLLTALNGSTRIATALATANGYLYFADFNPGNGSIGRVLLNGTGLNESFIPNVNYPAGVATDGTYVYWVDHGFQQNSIGRALLGSSGATNVQPAFISEPGGPDEVAVDSLIDPTTTTLACTPSPVATGSPTTCTATVSDSASSAPPTGTVNLTGNGAAFFSGNPCTLTAIPGGGASCVVGAVPTTGGNQGFHAAYSGDAMHRSSSGDVGICAGTVAVCGTVPPPPPPPPTPPPPPKPPTKPICTVPKLKGKSLTSARKLLSVAHCAVGKVNRPRAKRHHRLGPLVIGSQNPAPGRKLTAGSKVAVVLVKAPKHAKRR